MESTVKQRLIQYLKYKKITQRAFARTIGVSDGYVNAIRKSIQPDTINSIAMHYPDFNTGWLLTGEGEMIKDNNYTQSEDLVQIPLYSMTAACGFMTNIESREFIEEYLTIPSMPKVDGAIRTAGDSMYPIVKAGDIVFYKIIENIENVQYGQMYLISVLIEGDLQLMVKYIKKSEKGDDYLLFVSHNPHHEPKDYPKSCIQKLALVKANLRFNVI